MKLVCEVKEVKSKKQSLDMIYTLKLETSDPIILELGAYPADQLFEVEVELSDG